MIEKISLAQIATFNNVADIDNLKMVNYIYGSNGTGKTTISNLLYAGDAEIYKHCSVSWGSDTKLKTLVYNKQFRDDNFGKGNIAGVFTLGKATKEQLEEIETLRGELEKVKKDGLKRKETLETQKNEREKIVADFKQWCWTELFKKYDPFFAKAFEGLRNNSAKFADRVESEGRANKSEICELDDLQKRAQTIFSTTPIRLSKIEIPDIGLIQNIEANKIWGKRIVGKADISIAKLIDHLNISDWVNQGRDHIERDSDICPFCQQKTITADFKKELESYFDEEYVTNMDLIKKCTDDYIHGTNTLNEAILTIIDRESRNTNTKLKLAEFTPLTVALSKAFETNISIIQSKQKESSRSFELTYTASLIENIIAKISVANAEIDKHNKLVDDYKEEKDRLINDVWRYVSNNISVEQHIKNIDYINKAIAGISKQRDQLREKYQKINDDIKLKNKNVTSVQPTVDAINDILAHYGFENFRIDPRKDDPNCYQIVRNDGTPVGQTLSEGEVTFITFLYYLQLVNGGDNAENVLEDRILVIDDPISSLDSTVLFVVSSLIKEVIKRVKSQDKTPYNVKQIIILTHNAYFHKEVSFVDGRSSDKNDVGYWLIRKTNNESKIISCENKNPIKGSYEMLWDELRDMENLSLTTIQNTMRRIIEVYFKTMGSYKDEDILDRIDKANEKEICRSLMVWINDGSHCVPDDMYYVPNGETVYNYAKVFRDIFEKLGHIGHYNMMMKEDIEKPKRRTDAVGATGSATQGLIE